MQVQFKEQEQWGHRVHFFNTIRIDGNRQPPNGGHAAFVTIPHKHRLRRVSCHIEHQSWFDGETSGLVLRSRSEPGSYILLGLKHLRGMRRLYINYKYREEENEMILRPCQGGRAYVAIEAESSGFTFAYSFDGDQWRRLPILLPGEWMMSESSGALPDIGMYAGNVESKMTTPAYFSHIVLI